MTPNPNWDASQITKSQPRVARISTLEIAIRAQAKRFLAHPVVVQQLEAIWAGTIVFHSSADNLHRPAKKITPNQNRGYGGAGSRGPILQASPDRLQPAKQREHLAPVTVTIRRSVTLYDPRDASLFKLSRLRVPRYRQFLSTLSFAVLLGLFLAVMVEKSLRITALEVIFWFWSAGFMLDEIVGFNEQGFSLYILSFWNAFDVGILLLLICYYCMRLYGILMPDLEKRHVANMAYDVLAANAVLLFPRLFSVLDHYRYFSQLLIAFRMMAMDLVAVFILIIISCSGFLVAFTLSFGDEIDAGSEAYALFQMLMGFTPAAWEQWPQYNILGKVILTLFLFICHFLIVTILITVLTNSFMAIVQNANEEHQFVFAVNTISMVKSDALFSYIAPTNILAWLLTPLRYALPFRQFVRINRTVIKITHFPVLFVIYLYERVILRGAMLEATELVEQRGRSGPHVRAFDAPTAGLNLFSPQPHRLREHSVATFHKDRALAEVFRRPFRDETVRATRKSHERRKTSNVVNSWMQNMGPNGTASPPAEQDHSIVDRLETRRRLHRRSQNFQRRRGSARDFSLANRSVASDPEDFLNSEYPPRPMLHRDDSDLPTMSMEDLPEQTDGDGDDELVTNDDDENMTIDRKTDINDSNEPNKKNHGRDYFESPRADPVTQNVLSFKLPPIDIPAVQSSPTRPQRRRHVRNVSTTTILYNPTTPVTEGSSSPSFNATTAKNSARNTAPNSGAITPASAGKRTPKRATPGTARARPVMPSRSAFQSAPNLAGMLMMDNRMEGRRPSLVMDIGSDIGDNKAIGGGFVGAIPSSFATQMAFATGAMHAGRGGAGGDDDQQRMSRLMLARMNNLEEGFKDIIREVKDWRREDNRSNADDPPSSRLRRNPIKKSRKEGKTKNRTDEPGGDWVDEAELAKGEKRSSV